MKQIESKMGFKEFILLMGFMMGLVSLSGDAMLPALPEIGTDLNVKNINDTQLIISFAFIGLAIGQMFYGPLSDNIGRKPSLYLSFSIFIVGCVLSSLSDSLTVMLVGRVLQGFGVSGPKIVSVAIVRDKYEGEAMARAMSFIMMIFIFVPMIAPSLGQGIVKIADWRWIFNALLFLASLILLWSYLRLPETNPQENRKAFSFGAIKRNLSEIFRNRFAMVYTIVLGILSSAFLGYLSLVQPIFQKQYELGDLFPAFFAFLALSMGASYFLNGKLVMRFGMKFLSKIAFLTMGVVSSLFIFVSIYTNGHPPLLLMTIYLIIVLFCTGIIWGNLNALAMEPLGHIAGIGAAFVGSIPTLISIPFGILIGRMYDNSVLPLVIGFALTGLISIPLVLLVDKKETK